VSTFDPVVLAGAFLFTAVMVLFAAVLPARRAASIEPMQALRTE
jgi:ABC-type lipoprotein release transport system permease subunit